MKVGKDTGKPGHYVLSKTETLKKIDGENVNVKVELFKEPK